ncbi:MAG: hypothetical protein ABJG78_17670 [Cyclobacteriaceae bacterium]
MPKKSRRIFRAALFAALSVVVINVLAALLGESLKEFFKETFPGYFPILVAAIFLLVFFIEFLRSMEGEKQGEKEQEEREYRQLLLGNLKDEYQKRLKEKLKDQSKLNIPLNAKFTTQGTSEKTIEDFFIESSMTDVEDLEELFRLYNEKIKRLLILGEPGSGKSILLLRLSLLFMELAEKDESYPIPLILNLVTWRKSYDTFEEWLEKALSYDFGSFSIPKKYIEELLNTRNFILLLDGFDEINKDDRLTCFEKLTPYLKKASRNKENLHPELIVSSRIFEYESGPDAPVFASIKIQPLGKKDIDNSIEPLVAQNDPDARKLSTALETHPNLYYALNSPFFLHMTLFINLTDVSFDLSTESTMLLREQITNEYVNTELKTIAKYKKEKMRKWLGWLAYQMQQKTGNVKFELADMQPDWASKKSRYHLVLGSLTMILLLIFLDILIFNLPTDQILAIDILAFFGFIAIMFIGSILNMITFKLINLVVPKTFKSIYQWMESQKSVEIKTKEFTRFSLKKFDKKKFKKTMISYTIFLFVLFPIIVVFDPDNNDVSFTELPVVGYLAMALFGLSLASLLGFFEATFHTESFFKI